MTRSGDSKAQPWHFIALSYAISWSLLGTAIILFPEERQGTLRLAIPFFILASFAPSVAVSILKGPRFLLAKLSPKWPGMLPFTFAGLTPIACGWAVGGGAFVMGWAPELSILSVAAFSVASLMGSVPGLIGGPIGEEPGWRGYLLPAFAERMGLFWAAVAVGVVWAVWHGPALLFASWRSGMNLTDFLPLYLVSVIGLSLFLAAMWKLSAGSIWPSIVGHSVHNTTQGALPILGLSSSLPKASLIGLGWFTATGTLLAGALVFCYAVMPRPRASCSDGSPVY